MGATKLAMTPRKSGARSDSAWGSNNGNDDSNDDDDSAAEGGEGSSSAGGGGRRSARKSRDRHRSSASGKQAAESEGASAKAEVGSAIDLRKLAKAKKVQVFRGPGSETMVVGQRRLVVIEARPTEKEPHQGVVEWMSSLDNVASIALEIQPGSNQVNSKDVSVALNVVVKRGLDHTFLMGVHDSAALVQSIYARLNGEEPPALIQQRQQQQTLREQHRQQKKLRELERTASSTDAAAVAAAFGGSSGTSGDEAGSSSVLPPRTPSRSSGGGSGTMPRSSAKGKSGRKHRSSHAAGEGGSKSARKQQRSSRKRPCGEGGEGGGSSDAPPMSPGASGGGEAAAASGGGNDSGDATSTPPSKSSPSGTGVLSPLRIVLSPTGRGKRLSLEMTSISNAEGTLSLVEGGTARGNDVGNGGEGALSEAAERMSLLTRSGAAATTDGSGDGEESVAATKLPLKYALMLKNGVPEQAVLNKATAELTQKSEEVVITEADVKAMVAAFLAAPKSGEPATEEKAAAATPTSSSNKANSTSLLTDEEDKQTRKYRGMLKAGVPADAVRHKMVGDGIEARVIDLVLNPGSSPKISTPPASEPAPAAAPAPAALTDEEDKQTRKYRGMLKAGVPADAVKHKMVGDGVEPRLIRAVLGESEPAVGEGDDAALEVLSAEDEAKVSKYRGMLKAGVPTDAVRHKMVGDGLGARLVASVCGGDKGVDTGGTERWQGRDSNNSAADGGLADAGKTAQAKKPKVPASKLLTLHWTPLGLSEEEHANSVWATLAQPGDGSGGGADGDGGEEANGNEGGVGATPGGGPRLVGAGRVLSPEMQKLELLFSKKAAAKPVAAEGADMDVAGKAKAKKAKKAGVLDTARMQNLGIGLRSFKGFPGGAFAIGPAVAALEVGLFSQEQLARLDEMLPNDQEVAAVELHAKTLAKEHAAAAAEKKTSAAAAIAAEPEPAAQITTTTATTAANAPTNNLLPPAGLEPAELFVLGFSGVARVKPKVTVLALMGTLELQASEACQSLACVSRASGQAAKSTNLARLLAEVLAVGNVMNQGTSKGGAKGITVDSLLKLTQTKSVCKTFTVLDFITGSLLGKEEARQARVAEERAEADILGDGEDEDDDDEEDDDNEEGEEDEVAGGIGAEGNVSTNATLGNDATLNPALRSAKKMVKKKKKKNSGQGGDDDESAPLNFYLDLPDLDEASRLPFGELAAHVASLRQGLALGKRELGKLKDEASKEVKEAAKKKKAAAAKAAKLQLQKDKNRKEVQQEEPKLDSLAALQGDFSGLAKVAAASAEAIVAKGTGGEDAKVAGDASEDNPRAALMAMLQARAGEPTAAGGAEAAAAPPSTPQGRGADATREDEATAVATTREAAASAGLRASAALASDPRAGLMAALRTRSDGGDDDEEYRGDKEPKTQAGSTLEVRAASEQQDSQVSPQPLALITPTAKAESALREFLEGKGEALVSQAEAALLEAKVVSGDMAAFFGEKGGAESAAHVFDCLRQFAGMTRESRCRAEARNAERARSERLKARQEEEQRLKQAALQSKASVGSVAAASQGSSSEAAAAAAAPVSSSDHVDALHPGRSRASVEALAAAAAGTNQIDPKAGMMAEIRLAREARLDRALSSTTSKETKL
jgi:hypothetical protein